MKRLIVILQLVAGMALADTTYVDSAAGTPSGKAMVLSGAATANWITVVGPSSGSAVAYSPTLTGSVTLTGTVTIQVDMDWDLAANKTFTLSTSTRHSSVDTLYCSNTFVITTGVSSGTRSVTCSGGPVSLVAGDQVKMTFSVPALGSVTPDTVHGTTGVNSFVTWPQTLFFCATAGSSCVCNGICAGNSCGTQFSTVQSTACSCDCTVAGCTGLSLSGPAGFSCSQSGSGSDLCTWSALSGASTYTEARVSPSATVCNAIAGTSCSDTPGAGSFSYNLTANGSCTPAIGGTTLSSKTTNASSTSVVISVIQSILGFIN
jgi:hypothetical protein